MVSGADGTNGSGVVGGRSTSLWSVSNSGEGQRAGQGGTCADNQSTSCRQKFAPDDMVLVVFSRLVGVAVKGNAGTCGKW